MSIIPNITFLTNNEKELEKEIKREREIEIEKEFIHYKDILEKELIKYFHKKEIDAIKEKLMQVLLNGDEELNIEVYIYIYRLHNFYLPLRITTDKFKANLLYRNRI